MNRGVGTELHSILDWWGFRPTKSCQCKALQRYYNQKGPDWCQEHLDEIVDQILREAGKRKVNWWQGIQQIIPTLSRTLPECLQRIVLTRIVQVCINRARRF